MNRIFLMGRLTRDPEVRYPKSENPMPIARFGIAVNKTKSRADGITADFFNVVAFNRLAAFSEKYLKKGTKIMISGRVQTGYYDRNGINMPFFEVAADTIEFAESRAADSAGTGNEGMCGMDGRSGKAAADDGSGFIHVDDAYTDELPFMQ